MGHARKQRPGPRRQADWLRLKAGGVNSTCAGTSGVYRIDTKDDLAWLSQFVD